MDSAQAPAGGDGRATDKPFGVAAPQPTLPKGGGAVRGIGEKFAANPVTGTGSLTVPITLSPGRSGFGPLLSLAYDSGAGNGPFGVGWSLSLPAISRRTDKGLPQYRDAAEADVFILSGAEDLAPVYKQNNDGTWPRDSKGDLVFDEVSRNGFRVKRYRPRVEGSFARIERWTRLIDGDTHWRSISKDNVLSVYGGTPESRIADPANPSHVFSWLICQSYDDKGNAVIYGYVAENDDNVDLSRVNERNRTRSANRYLKSIRYGNRQPLLLDTSVPSFRQLHVPAPDFSTAGWMFEAVFDYGEGHYQEAAPDADGRIFGNASLKPPVGGKWPARLDPFSSYRSCFEVRSYRLCRRVLMFHHFPSALGVDDYLVRSTEFAYREKPNGSFIASVFQSGFKRITLPSPRYLKRSLPPLEFEYSVSPLDELTHDQLPLQEVDESSLKNIPGGIDGSNYRWVDLDGEGISGVFSEQSDAWFYKPNLGEGEFGPVQCVAPRPSLAALNRGRRQLIDLAGDGNLDLVDFEAPTPGFFSRTEDAGWDRFRTFIGLPNIDWQDPNLRFVDLTGDGHADLLITGDQVFCWYGSRAEEGFGPASHVSLPFDEEVGPRLVFADAAQSIYLADMSGDGLTDLVRIRVSEVCYWPNVGYGRFGAKVTLDNAPWFDDVESFDQRRVLLTDTDGSGPTDILYLGRDGIRVYLNQHGNSLSSARLLSRVARTDNLTSVSVVDFLGRGTACLLWSSPLPSDSRRSLRYMDLMGGIKPHLLTIVRNNLGAETRIEYASSTKFYLEDKKAGTPWITRLPFPVHVVTRVETYDYISRSRFVSRYAYHHGFFDGAEREFRGFGMVEQFDTEEFAALSASDAFPTGDNIDATSHVPPVHTKSWFHTGSYLGREHVSNYFAGLLDANDKGEYYREPGLSDSQARTLLLPDTVLPKGLTVDEEREACRALKGAMLRQEVYALDGTGKADHPYTVTEQNFTIRHLQPRGANRYGVFFTHTREALSYHYERNPADPRITHALTLEVDEFGNELKSAAIGYGRRQPDLKLAFEDRAKQVQTLLTYTENDVTKPIAAPGNPDAYRTPLPVEARTYELTGYIATGAAGRFQNADFVQPAGNGLAHIFDSEISYEDPPSVGRQRRLIEQVRTLYRKNDLSQLLVLGTMESLALPGEAYKLACTPGLLARVFKRPHTGQPPEDLMPIPANVLGGQGADRGGYVASQTLKASGAFPTTDPNDHWWIPSGRIFLSPNTADTTAQEFARASNHFFLPQRYRDPFGQTATVTYDANDLLAVESRDALGNRVTVGERNAAGVVTTEGNDYRVLQARLITDPNGNRAEAAFDTLGMVAGTAVMGKPLPATVEGDSLAGFVADLESAQIDGFHDGVDPHASASALLRDATTRIVYDFDRFQRTRLANPNAPTKWLPAYAATLARETHAADPLPPQGLELQIAFSYSDGFGREIQKKIQAEPGPLIDGGPVITPRWVGSGWTLFNNKGKPVRRYEPFFSATHRFEFGTQVGVSPILFYDPIGRAVATLHPNHTWEKVLFDPWRQETWDVSDTVLVADPRIDPDVGDFFKRLPTADYLPGWHAQRAGGALGAEEQDAARKAAVHAETPAVVHADSLGRPFLSIAHNKFKYTDTPPAALPVEEFHSNRIVFDIEGNQRAVIDARNRVVMRYDYDMLGARIHQASMEAGARWMLNDVAGKPIRAWDSRDHRIRSVYDGLRRVTEVHLQEGVGGELLIGRTFFGETQINPEANNLRGKVVQLFDQAGVATNNAYDFKGNLLRSERKLAQDYSKTLNWSAVVPLDAPVYASRTRYDALSRPIQVIAPHSDQPGFTVNIIQPVYNAASLLDQVHAWLNESSEPVGMLVTSSADLHAVTNINYDAKGQRKLIEFGNDVRTTYTYDPLTFRLTSLVTRHGADDLQDLHYTYDAAGNITHIRDDAQQTIYFRNTRVEPSAEYRYDALFRLIEATGREHLGQVGGSPIPHSYNDAPRVGVPHRGDRNAMGWYLERYVYDAVGNFERMKHIGTDPANPGWTREYNYGESSLIEAGKQSNRLTSSFTDPLQPENYSIGGDGYDAHGNMLRMPQLQEMRWDFRDQLHMSRRQKVNAADVDGVQHQGERTWYVYDASGQRVRKVTELATGVVKDERIYLGGFEIYRKSGANPLVRETLHIMDDKQRVALVEQRTAGSEAGVPPQLVRFQFGNHLGSASLELDDQARIISYEEYTPYGSTSYQAVRSQTETPKRYRYSGMERDEESGFNYHGARYYAPWLGRWTSCDPAGFVDSANAYQYLSARPLVLHDPDGRDEATLWLFQQSQFRISPLAARTHRGITGLQRSALLGLDYAYGPGTGLHWAHPEGQSFVIQRTNTAITLTPDFGKENMKKQHESKILGEKARKAGEFAREWDGNHNVDLTVPKGTRVDQPAPEDFERPLADFNKAVEKTLGKSPVPPEGKIPEFPPVPEPPLGSEAQLSLVFDKKPAAPAPVAATPAVPRVSPPVPTVSPPTPPPAAPPASPGAQEAGKGAGSGAIGGAARVFEKGALIVAIGEEGKDHDTTANAFAKYFMFGAVASVFWRPAVVLAMGASFPAAEYVKYKIIAGTDRALSEGAAAANPGLDQSGKAYQPPKSTTLGEWLGF